MNYCSVSGKVQFETKIEATKSTPYRRRKNKSQFELKSYKCKHCNFFHIGKDKSKTKSDNRVKKGYKYND